MTELAKPRKFAIDESTADSLANNASQEPQMVATSVLRRRTCAFSPGSNPSSECFSMGLSQRSLYLLEHIVDHIFRPKPIQD